MNSCEISIRHGSTEHINKKSFPACTRVTGHATFSQPLQPHFSGIYVTASRGTGGGRGKRRRGEGWGWGEFYTGDGWRAALTETEDERAFARRERDAKETGQRDGDYATGLFWVRGKPTAYERNISLKNHPRTRCSRVPSGPVSFSSSVRPCVHLPLWYRFTRDLATDDGIPSLAGKKKRKKKKGEEERERKGENR